MNPIPAKIRPRIVIDTALFLTILCTPWWFTAAVLFVCVAYFKNFYEAFFFGFLFDVLYGANIASLHGFRFVFSSIFLVLLFVVNFVKEKVRM